MEYYSGTRNMTLFEGKWMQLKDITLIEVSQDQKHKSLIFFSQKWKIDPMINIYTKTSTIIYKLRSKTCLQQWNYSIEPWERGKGKENAGALVISHNIRCEGREYKDVY
jgi:hypothetical protein